MLASLPDIIDADSLQVGDMPGDKIQITDSHIKGARIIFPELWALLEPLLADGGKAVVSVHGGSGVGKSETGALLAHFLQVNGIGAYILSGDNYPHRIPSVNDEVRQRVFDEGGRGALAKYLGSPDEINFDEINAILAAFKEGQPTLHLKRMGRTDDERWYDDVDVSDTDVLVLEWTHGNNPNLHGVDIPILLNSTPAETLAHRRSRARDGGVDSPFTSIVLDIEQAKLHAQSPSAKIILTKDRKLVDHDAYARLMGSGPTSAPMLNAYPDSIGGHLSGLVDLLGRPELTDAFGSAYLLPSVFDSDLDRGFSVISYHLNDAYASRDDVTALGELGVDLKLDFVLNHASVLSPQFQDVLARGEGSRFADFFIDWNKFWAGHGEMTDEGYIQPDPELIKDMFFRKAGLPILMVRLPDGTEKPYWNTFYQSVSYPALDAQDLMAAAGLQYTTAAVLARRVNDTIAHGGKPASADFTGLEAARDAVVDAYEGRRRYLGQLDLNIASPEVWQFYDETLARLAGYGASIVRLDAFAYAPKEPGARNFLNVPSTWELLDKLKELADRRGLALLPEIHATYAERIHEALADKGFMTYDFFLPGLLIDALDRGDGSVLKRWINELTDKKIRSVNMLGCHDGIPLLDLKGLLSEDQIEQIIATVKARGGRVKDLHGATNVYYQVNATYFSALGGDEARLLLARAVQIFMPGKPQVWYLDLFAGVNDIAAVERLGQDAHKEINRTNLGQEDVAEGLKRQVVLDQLTLLRFRRSFPAFGFDATCTVEKTTPERLIIEWSQDGHTARLDANLSTAEFKISGVRADGGEGFEFAS